MPTTIVYKISVHKDADKLDPVSQPVFVTLTAGTGIPGPKGDKGDKGDTGDVSSTRIIASGTGLTGGGDLSEDRTLEIDEAVVALASRIIASGIGLTGGGDLSTDRTLAIDTEDDLQFTGTPGGSVITVGGRIISDVTVNIPTDFATMQEAIDFYSMFTVKQGVTITLLIEPGHQPAVGVAVKNGDFSHFSMESVDAVVTAAAGYTGIFIHAINAKAPALNFIFDADNKGGAGLFCFNSDALITSNGGIRNAADRAVYATAGSRINASGADLTNATSRALWAARGGIINAENCNISGCRTNGTDPDEAAIYSSRGGIINAAGCTANNIESNRIVLCKRVGFINVHDSVMSGSTVEAVAAWRGGSVSVNNTTITGINGHGLVADGPSSSVEAAGCTVTAAGGNSGDGLRARSGGVLRFIGTVSDFGNRGAFCDNGGLLAMNAAIVAGSGGHGIFSSGGQVSIVNGSVTGSGGNDLSLERGGIIHAFGCSTTNGAGSPDLTDTNVGSFNAIHTNRGIIWV